MNYLKTAVERHLFNDHIDAKVALHEQGVIITELPVEAALLFRKLHPQYQLLGTLEEGEALCAVLTNAKSDACTRCGWDTFTTTMSVRRRNVTLKDKGSALSYAGQILEKSIIAVCECCEQKVLVQP